MSLQRWHDTGERFDFSGHSIFFKRHGAGASALLLIHGFPTASWDYAAIWPRLARRWSHLLAPDLLGFGYSDKPLPHEYRIAEQADLCEALLQRQGVQSVDILAHDYGVSVAQELLARHRERAGRGLVLRSVALLNGGLFPETHRATLGQRLLRSPLGPLWVRLMNERSFHRALAGVFGPDTRPGEIELHDFWTLVAHKNGPRVMPSVIRYIDERRRHRERWVGALQHTTVPLRLINGPADPVSGRHMAERYRELVPNPDVVLLEGIGHYPQVEAPDQVLRAFLAFHDRLDAAARPPQ